MDSSLPQIRALVEEDIKREGWGNTSWLETSVRIRAAP